MAKRAIPLVKTKDKSGLLLAFDHVEPVSKGPSNYAAYSLFTPGWLVGYDGVVAAGYRIAEDMIGAPHTETFRHALMRAGNPYSVTTLANGNFVVRGAAVRVEVPTMDPKHIPGVMPDPALVEVGPQLLNGMLAVSRLAATRTDRVIASAVQVRQQSVVATNGNTIVEAYHGYSLPYTGIVPREFVDILDKCKGTVTHAGWSDETFTLWFGPNAWVRCTTYRVEYPDTDIYFARMIADCKEYRHVPLDLLVAVETLRPFMDEPMLMLTREGLNTKEDLTGASFKFDHHFPADALRLVPYDAIRYAASYGEAIAFNANGFYWYGQQLRGVTSA